MTIFGLHEGDVRALVGRVRPDLAAEPGSSSAAPATLYIEVVADAFARACWTSVAEPADELAGTVIGTLGAGHALTALLADDPVWAFSTALGQQSTGTALQHLQRGVARWRPRASSAMAMRSLEQAARFDCRLVLPDDPDWPSGLADLGDRAPIALWARGRSGPLGIGPGGDQGEPVHGFDGGLESVAVVGARAATGYGEHVATEFASGLAERGAVVVSGGAYGIDGAAHRGALATGGTTVAVLAGGLDRLYPAGHDALLSRVAGQGVLLAEVPCGTPPTRYRFLQRNRLIAAISCSVVVIEAGARSGSLNTAGHAAEIGRPIGAVPGPITSSASAGCHRLLREFPATCVTSVDEVLALHRTEVAPDAHPGFDRPTPETLQVLDALAPRRGRDTAEIARLGGLSEAGARAVLGRLELEGVVTRGPDGWVRRRE